MLDHVPRGLACLALRAVLTRAACARPARRGKERGRLSASASGGCTPRHLGNTHPKASSKRRQRGRERKGKRRRLIPESAVGSSAAHLAHPLDVRKCTKGTDLKRRRGRCTHAAWHMASMLMAEAVAWYMPHADAATDWTQIQTHRAQIPQLLEKALLARRQCKSHNQGLRPTTTRKRTPQKQMATAPPRCPWDARKDAPAVALPLAATHEARVVICHAAPRPACLAKTSGIDRQGTTTRPPREPAPEDGFGNRHALVLRPPAGCTSRLHTVFFHRNAQQPPANTSGCASGPAKIDKP